MFNLLVVWTLTGIWHGAHWQFVAWGLLYFLLLMFEKLLNIPKWLKEKAKTWQRVIYRLLALLAVIFGWVLFRADGIKPAIKYILAMFTPLGMKVFVSTQGISVSKVNFTVLPEDYFILIAAIVIGILFATPLIRNLGYKITGKLGKASEVISYIGYLLLFGATLVVIIASNYNPFIYFNF
jgi:D-alanyl-lipoteichoic acid acyltransferase DltB (MBOAT superfamily)